MVELTVGGDQRERDREKARKKLADSQKQKAHKNDKETYGSKNWLRFTANMIVLVMRKS
jgi:hypothetical protein